MATYKIRGYIARRNLLLAEIVLKGDNDTATLRGAIYREAARLLELLPRGVILYRIKRSINLSDEKDLYVTVNSLFREGQPSQSELEELEGTKKINQLFSDGLQENHLHIVACIPKDGDSSKKDKVTPRGVKRKRDQPDDTIQEQKQLGKIAKRAPASLSKPSAFRSAAQDIVCCNRPFDFDTIPITLLQEEFGQFKDDCELLPSPKAQELLQALTIVACKWYDNRSERRSEIKQLLFDQADLYLRAETIRDTDYKTDGHSIVNIMPAVIRQCKHETGCALLEAIAHYVQFLMNGLSNRGMCDRFPCILMVDIGSCLGLYGCLWTGERIYVEPLTPLYDLTIHWTDESGRRAIAAALDAFLNTISRLEAHYVQVASIAPTPLPDPSLQDRTYPYKTSYEDENGQQINFIYESRIAETLVFIAKPDVSSDKDLGTLCIKFTRRYSEDVHRFLAQLGYAPQLRAVTPLPGGWIMVVMDYSEYKHLPNPRLILSDQIRRTIGLKVLEIVQTLHGRDFVHGDIRFVNVLIDPETLDGIKIHLIDFDWAGRVGEVVYPMRINTTTISRPDGVSDGKPILQEHDMAMVNNFL